MELTPARLADTALGTAPLVHGEVYNGLTYRSLALLQPCALTAALHAEPLAPTGEQQLPLVLQLAAAPQANQQQAAAAAAAYSQFPALHAELGQPLSMTLTVTNHGRTTSGSGSNPSGAGDGLELELEAAVACQPVRGSEQDEAAAAGGGAPQGLSAMWAGQLWSGLRLRVPPGERVSQRLGLCLLAPGLHRISLQQWQCRPAGSAAAAAQQQHEQQQKQRRGGSPGPLLNTLVAVQPCFVLATQ